jgi:hypothetical protein
VPIRGGGAGGAGATQSAITMMQHIDFNKLSDLALFGQNAKDLGIRHSVALFGQNEPTRSVALGFVLPKCADTQTGARGFVRPK